MAASVAWLRNGGVAVCNGPGEGGGAKGPRHAGERAAGKQQAHHLQVALLARDDERGVALLRGSVHVGAPREQLQRDVKVVPLAGDEQRQEAALHGRAHCRAARKQLPHHPHVAIKARGDERRGAPAVGGAHVGAPPQQLLAVVGAARLRKAAAASAGP